MPNQKNNRPSDSILTRKPFPGSSKVYVGGKENHLHVPMRQIKLSPTKTEKGLEENAPLLVYDTSGPYTDPTVEIDLKKGLNPLRRDWVLSRGDEIGRASCRERV